MSRRDTIWKWVFYTAGVFLLLLLQGLALDHISLLHVHPYLPPVMVAVLAMFEGAYGGMGVALTMGLLFDLTQPGLIPCFHILAFFLAALAAAAVANYLITPGLLCAVLIAGSLLFGQRSLDCVSATTLTTLQSAAATVLALACSFLFEGGIHVSNVSPLAWSIIAYLAILCTSLGYFLQNKAMCAISARSVALLQCLCPVMTALFSFLLLGERLSAAGILGSALLLIALVAATLLRSETPAERIRKS